MTTTPTPSISVYPLTGTTTGPFGTGWTYAEGDDVWVYVTLNDVQGGDLAEGVDYDLTSTDPQADGGQVMLAGDLVPVGGWTSGHQLIVRRWTARRQGIALPDTEGHKPRATERGLDRAMRIAEELSDDLDLAVKVAPGETPPSAADIAALAGGIGGILDQASELGAAAGAAAAADKQDETVTLYAGGAPRTLVDILAEMPVSIWEFSNLLVAGDWTAAINAANLKKRVVRFPAFVPGYRVDGETTDRPLGNMHIGDGVGESFWVVDYTKQIPGTRWTRKIPPSASSQQAGLDNLGFKGVQPDVAARADLKIYPWIIDAVNCARLFIGNVRFSSVSHAMNLAGNTGGLVGTSWDIGAHTLGVQAGGAVVQKWTGDGANKLFSLTVKSEASNQPNVFTQAPGGSPVLKALGTDYAWVNGVLTFVTAPTNLHSVLVAYPPCLDFWKVGVWQNWPFGLEGSLTAYWDGDLRAASIGRVDGFAVSVFCNFAGLIDIMAEPGSGEGPFGNWGVLQDDSTYARIDMAAGRLAVGTAYLSGSGTDAKSYGVNVFGNASLTVGASVITGPLNAPVPFIQNSAYLSFLGGQVQACSLTTSLARTTGGFFRFDKFSWLSGTNQTRTVAALRQTGGRVHFEGNLFPYVGTGGGPQIRVDNDDAHVITGNSLVGWDYLVPATGAQGQYGPNAVSSLLYGMTITTGTFDPAPHLDSFFLQATSPITAIGGGKAGRVIHVTFGSDVQINASATVKLQGDGYAVYSAGDTTAFINVNNVWQEFGRCVNKEIRFRDLVCADPLPLNDLDHGKTIYLSGCAAVPTIGTIVVARKGTRVSLRFDGSTTVNGNSATTKLRTLANLVTANRTTLEIISTGAVWEQVSGSVNS